MRKLLILGYGMLCIANTYAALNGLSYHSRANCGGFNESISWDFTVYRYLATASYHFASTKLKHITEAFKAYTWRSAAYHWYNKDDYNPDVTKVIGFHYLSTDSVNYNLQATTSATGCNIYDGWWDKGTGPTKGIV